MSDPLIIGVEPTVPEHTPTMVRQVTWNFPKNLYERLEKAKAEGTKSGDIPPRVSDESFGLFLVERALGIYEQMLAIKAAQDKLVVDPAVLEPGTYVGRRTVRLR